MQRLDSLDIVVGSVTLATLLVVLASTLLREKRIYLAAAGFKVVCFIGLIVFLHSAGYSDSYYYHDEAGEYSESFRSFVASGDSAYFKDSPFWSVSGDQTHRVMSFAGMVMYFNGGSFLGVSAFFCVFGLIGQIYLHKGLSSAIRDPKARRWIDLGCLFLPSLSFWSSGLLKDPVGILGLGLTVYGLSLYLQRVPGMRKIFFILFGLYVIFLYRIQVFPCVLLGTYGLFVTPTRNSAPMTMGRLVSGTLVFGALIAGMTAFSTFSEENIGYSLSSVPTHIFETSAWYRDAGYSQVGQVASQASWLGIVMGAPLGIVNALFRPFPWDVRTPLMAVAAFENLIIAATAAIILRRWSSAWRADVGTQRREMVFSLLFVLSLSAVVGVSTLNLGSTSRYRIPALPIFFGLAAVVSQTRRESGERGSFIAGRRIQALAFRRPHRGQGRRI